MYQNPFSEPITPAADTDPVQNQDLIRALLGEDAAQEFAGLVSDQPKSTRQPRPNLKALADAALTQQATLLSASAEKQAEQFLTVELRLQFQEQIKTLVDLELLQTNEKGEKGITAI
ncbi:MAG: hypothetical protein NT003_00315, partial [Candidatus Magasanikbacteria bacterium]|nr:hypothetical protein [Candidatus Magasanikbacteria bacterium]